MEIDFLYEKHPWKWSPSDLDSFLPGTQSWLLELARAFARKQHLVTVYWDNDETEWEGVSFRNRKFYSGSSQIGIAWNHRNAIPEKWHADKAILWTQGTEDWMRQNKRIPSDLDKVVAISKFHQDRIRENCPFPGKVVVIGPGLDKSEFETKENRDENLAIYSSSWDRGLDRLIQYWSKIKRELPNLKLIVTYCPSFMSKVVGRKVEFPRDWKMDGISIGAYDRKGMGALYRRASYLLYPCHGVEMYCLSAYKAQYAGCIPITTDHMALAETVKCGTTMPPGDWLIMAITIMKSKEIQKTVRAKMGKMKFPSWEDVAAEWEEKIFA